MLTKYTAKHPNAQAALAEPAKHVRHPFDPSESDRRKASRCKNSATKPARTHLDGYNQMDANHATRELLIMRPVLNRKEVTPK